MNKYASPAALIAHTRSGGTFLATCLSNHPDVFCPRGEPLLEGMEWQKAFPGATAVGILKCITRAAFYKVGMCKITYEQAGGDVLRYLKEANARVVHLVRRNVVRTAVSQYITGAVVLGKLPNHIEHTDQPMRAVSITLQPVGFLARCRWLVEQQQQMASVLAGLGVPVLPVAYADMMGGEGGERQELPQWLSHYICEFLGVERRVLGAHLRRVNAHPLSVLVSNWDQVEESLRGTEFQWCLDEEAKFEYRGQDQG